MAQVHRGLPWASSVSVCPDGVLMAQALPQKFSPSSVSLCIHNGEVVGNQRLVSYRIREEDGSYEYDKHIETANASMIIRFSSSDIDVEFTHFMPVSYQEQGLIRGIEDVRVYSHPTRGLLFLGTVVRGKVVQVFGTYPSMTVLREMVSPYGRSCEKNWVFFDDDKLCYCLSPFTLLNYLGDVVVVKPNGLGDKWRGSTNYIQHGDYKYAIVHLVTENREYKHAFVRVDCDFNVQVSSLFTFEQQRIEYCLGFCEVGDDIIIAYSVWDRCSKLMRITWDDITFS